jgi:hypothetical protein
MKSTPQRPIIIQNSNGRASIMDLVLPYVPLAFHDDDNNGLLPVSALSQPVSVELKVWEGARANDTYQLLWNGKVLGEEKVVTDSDQAGDTLTLNIPISALLEGTYSLGYRTTNIENGVSDDSEFIRVEVDRTPPGRPQLGPVKFPIDVEDGLTSAELTALGDVLEVEIGSYTGMAKHDLIQIFWGEDEGASTVVTATDMGLNRVLVKFDREFLEGLGEFDGDVTYKVTDRAGNTSAVSLPVRVQLKLVEAPSDFPAPILDASLGNLIDYQEAAAGVGVDIPLYPGAAAFDHLVLYWGNNAMLPVQIPSGNEEDEIVLSLIVPFDTVALTPNQNVSVRYEVERAGTLIGSSLATEIDVLISLPGPATLDAPTIQGTSLNNPNTTDNFIDEDDYELNARAIIAWKPGFEVSDDLNLHWGEQNIVQWYQIKDSDVATQRDLTIPISNTILKLQGTGAEIPVRYSLVRNANPNPNLSEVQPVVVRSKEELPGGENGLSGPAFITNAAGVVGPIENPNGAPVKINPYENIHKDQNLEFFFKGFDDNNIPVADADYVDIRELDDQDVINGYSFLIPDSILRKICIGYGEAYFKVVPAEGSNQSSVTSKVTRVRINMSRPASQCRARF